MLDATLRTNDSECPVLNVGGGLEDDLATPKQPGEVPFSKELRHAVYESMGLATEHIREIEAMVAGAPGRKPGKGALNNLVTLFPSRKNQDRRWLESHTNERLYAYRLERNPDVIGYVTQVPCTRITRIRGGKKNVTSANLDFLVFRRDGICLVECKDEDALIKLAKEKDEWQFDGERWTNTAYQGFANGLGIEFSVYTASRLFGVELQNEEYIYGAAWNPPSRDEGSICRRVEREIRNVPQTIDQLSECIPGFTIRHAARMIASERAFGMERVVPMEDTDRFYLFFRREHRDLLVEELRHDQLRETGELQIEDRLLLAREKDLLFAKARRNRLAAIAAGDEPSTRRMDDLAKRVAAGVANGISPLELCLPNFANSGNRLPRITQDQKDAVEDIATRWEGGEFTSRTTAWIELDALCKEKKVQTPHGSTLNRAIRLTDGLKRTLCKLGLRPFQKDKPRTDGSRCSLPSLAYGHTLIVDSSQFDQRVAPNLLTLFPSAVPRFYAGIDGATGSAMAQAFVFGAARTDGLAILLRDYVHRHGFLPRCIQLDRGPENTGDWIIEFCMHFGIELRWTPTGGSRYNGVAENAIGRVNRSVAHGGPGSTWPDQMGRGADGRVKSRRTATRCFAEINKRFQDFFLIELNQTRRSDDLSPDDLKTYCVAQFEIGGRSCAFDDAFLVWTSISIPVPKRIVVSRGVRLTEGAYSGSSLMAALKRGRVDKIRKDCINPSLIFVRANGRWHKAYRRDCQIWLTKSWAEQLFKTLSEPNERASRSVHNVELRIKRREAEMREALAGKESLTTQEPKNESEPTGGSKEPNISYPDLNWDVITSCELA